MRDTGTEWLYRLLSQPKRFRDNLYFQDLYFRLCLKELKGLINKGKTYMNRIGIIGAMQIEIDLLLEKLIMQEEQIIAGMPFMLENSWELK